MDEKLLSVFSAQVRFQCEYVLLAHERIRAALREIESRSTPPLRKGYGAQVALWAGVQDLLNAAANIAKAFWGQGGTRAVERSTLRASFEVKDASPLKNVLMRNNFEHFDERLDKWWNNSPTRGYLDMATGPAITTRTGDPLDAFRTLDTNTLEITFWGEPFSLAEIVGEAQRLLSVLDGRLRDQS